MAGGLAAMAAPTAHAAAPVSSTASAPPPSRTPATLILACDQASRSVLLLDATSAYWRSGSPDRTARAADLLPLWSWTPVHDPGLADLDPGSGWQNVSEAKARSTTSGPLLLTCASGGLVAAVLPGTGSVYWATSLPARANPHTVELLPDGNIAVAASTGGFVRVYTASQGARSGVYVSFALPGAHGLLWDAGSGLLWALGDALLVGLAVEGGAASPRLTAARTVALPEPGGHDLARALGADAPMWLSTSGHVRQFAVRTGAFVAYPDQSALDRPSVKRVSQNPVTGRVLTVSPEPGTPCPWCTSRIRFRARAARRSSRGRACTRACRQIPVVARRAVRRRLVRALGAPGESPRTGRTWAFTRCGESACQASQDRREFDDRP
ncbi:DUF6528 family protein [Streptomyces sp. NPDC023838]|uniref:DUF6528 family protein n=1 Tax=Streptomyces sp. NPDC023838 TaxID=3154325 RepID=UPI0033E4F3FF